MPASSGVQAQVPPGVFQFCGNAGSSGQRPRVPGPCFNCTEMGHIRANCPKLSKPYPFDISSVGSDIMCDSVSCSVNDVWINETICVNKVKGLSKDMYDNIEPMVFKCVNKVPDNSNACIADSEVSDSTMSIVQGYGEVVSPDKLGPSGSEPSGFSSEF